MTGRRKNKRQRTLSSSREERSNGKRTKTDDDDKQANVQRSRHRQNPSKLPPNVEATIPVSDDAKGGRALRPRTKGLAHSEEEDNSADETYNPLTTLMSAQKQSVLAKRRKAELYFKCTDRYMDEFFGELGLPAYFNNPPPPIPCTKVHKPNEECNCVQIIPGKIVASNVTQALLSFYASWVFAEARTLKPPTGSSKNTAANIYQPISLIASPVLWNVRPFRDPKKQKDGTYKLDREDKPDRDIREAWWWFLDCLERGLALKIPLEWTYDDESVPSERPEMPESFSNLLREVVSRAPRSACSSLDGTPVKKGASTSLDDTATIKPLSLSTIQEQDETFSPSTILSLSQLASELSGSASPALSLPNFELEGLAPSGIIGTSAEIKKDGFKTGELSGLSPPLAQGDSPIPAELELAYSIIKQHGLKETREEALRLEKYLADGRRKFDLKQSKQQLCNLLGPAENYTVLDGNCTGKEFAYVPRVEIEKADVLERCGNAGKTENAIDVEDTAMELNFRWLNFKGFSRKDVSELDVERKIGRLFVGLFRFAEMQESANTTTRFLGHLQLFGTSPRPDYAVRPAPGEWSHWPDNLRPIMASGDQKTPKSICRDNEAQIALNTRPLIILQILMYLDTRKTADAPLPGWMFNFSWITSSEGFAVYVHYPSINLAKEGEAWSWKMVSVMLTDMFRDVWVAQRVSNTRRRKAKAAFDKIASHTSFSLDQIRNWSQVRGCYGEDSIMNQLIARAHMEMGDYEWMYRKMEEEEKIGLEMEKGKKESATECSTTSV